MASPVPFEITFSSAFGSPAKIGPLSSLRFEGELLREAAGGPVLATHEEHQWVVNGERYTRLECDCSVVVRFARVDGSASATYGPFEHFSCTDGVAYADRQVFAFVDRSVGDWYCHDDGRHWPLMLVEPA